MRIELVHRGRNLALGEEVALLRHIRVALAMAAEESARAELPDGGRVLRLPDAAVSDRELEAQLLAFVVEARAEIEGQMERLTALPGLPSESLAPEGLRLRAAILAELRALGERREALARRRAELEPAARTPAPALSPYQRLVATAETQLPIDDMETVEFREGSQVWSWDILALLTFLGLDKVGREAFKMLVLNFCALWPAAYVAASVLFDGKSLEADDAAPVGDAVDADAPGATSSAPILTGPCAEHAKLMKTADMMLRQGFKMVIESDVAKGTLRIDTRDR